jgi:hypothetical protein
VSRPKLNRHPTGRFFDTLASVENIAIAVLVLAIVSLLVHYISGGANSAAESADSAPQLAPDVTQPSPPSNSALPAWALFFLVTGASSVLIFVLYRRSVALWQRRRTRLKLHESLTDTDVAAAIAKCEKNKQPFPPARLRPTDPGPTSPASAPLTPPVAEQGPATPDAGGAR